MNIVRAWFLGTPRFLAADPPCPPAPGEPDGACTFAHLILHFGTLAQEYFF